MAIAVDDTTVARVDMTHVSGTGNPITGTTASFTAPANSLLVVCSGSDTASADTNSVVTVSTNGAALTWTIPVERNGADGGGGHAAIARALVATERAGLTVTVSVTGHQIASDNNGSFKVYIVTGHNTTTPDGNVAENSSTTNSISGSVTVAGAGRLFGCATEWNDLGAPTSTDIESAFDVIGISGMSAYKSADHASGSQSINFDAAGAAAADWNWVVYEVVAAAGGGGAPRRTRARIR